MVETEADKAATPLVRIRGLTRRFGAVTAVDRVDLDILPGEFLCLLGPSGCGKSTLLRTLAGLEIPDSGRIELDGRDLAAAPPERRPFNIMFQSYALFPHLTVAGNIAYGLRRAGAGRDAVRARVDEMLRLVRLEGMGDRRIGQLSGGQRQRVALARALARNPRLLLLDEPLGALDRRLRTETQRELKALQRRLGTTFVTVTHDQEEAMLMADRIGLMDGGRLVQVGSPREVYERPATRFAAEFLGDANILDGTVVADAAGASRLSLGPGGTALIAMPADGHAPGPVTVAVRPDRIRLDPSDEPGLGAVARTTSFAGSSVVIEADLLDGRAIRIVRPAAELPSSPVAGEVLTLGIAPADVTVLPRQGQA